MESALNPKHQNNTRFLIVESLWASYPNPSQKELGGQSLSTVLEKTLVHLDPSQKPLAKNICYGVCRNYYFLEALVQQHLNKPLRNKDRDILFLLMAASYELLFLSTPSHAVFSEFVDLCQLRKKIWAKGLVNAVLRNIQREKKNFKELKDIILGEKTPIFKGYSKTEVLYEHPQWFIDLVFLDWKERAKHILEQNNLRAPMTLRVNKNHTNTEGYLNLLSENNIAATASPNTDMCIYLSEPTDVTQLPQFFDGWVSVQDEAAQQAAYLLDLKPGNKVLDACSAPGGKAAHLIELENSIDLTCLDANKKRLSRVEENLTRLSMSAHCIHANAEDKDDWWDGEIFDRILLDAPCSATGIIRRNPDIKILRQQNDLKRMADQQAKILEALWPCLANGGLLLYATCSIMKHENQEIIASFLEHYTEAALIPIDLNIGQSTNFGHQFFPAQNGPDGFFYALLRKN